MISYLTILAQSASDSGGSDINPITLLTSYGLPGIFIAAMLLGLLWAKPAVDRLITDKERAEKQRDELLRVYEEKMLPALAESITVTRDLKPVMQDVNNTLAQVKAELGRKQ